MERPHIWGVFGSSPHQSSCCDCRRLQAGDEYLNGNPVLAELVELWAFFPKIALFLCSLHRWLHSCVNGHPPSAWVSRSSVAPKPENHWHLLRQRKKPPLPLWWYRRTVQLTSDLWCYLVDQWSYFQTTLNLNPPSHSISTSDDYLVVDKNFDSRDYQQSALIGPPDSVNCISPFMTQWKVSEFSGICPHWFLWYPGYAAGQDFVCFYLDKGWFLQWPPVNHCQRDSGWVAWVLTDVESKELIVCFRSVSYNCIVLRKTIVRGICKQRIRHATFATILLFKNLYDLHLLVINFAKNNRASVSESLRSFDRHQ